MEPNGTQGKSSTQKWLIGCGIGCGAIIVILVILGVSGFFFVKNIVDEFKDTEAMMEALTEKYGRVREFTPEPDGGIREERLETFLKVREDFAPARDKIAGSFRALAETRDMEDIEVKRPRNIVKLLKMGFGVIPQVADYFKARNKALMDNGMGLGEYYYLYTLIYYSWLGKEPEDGPDFQMVGGDWEHPPDDVSPEERRDRTLRRLHRQLLPILTNQLEQLKSQIPEGSLLDWEKSLEAEISALESDRYRIPWQDGVPDVIAGSLRPFHDRLEDSYNPLTNPLELAIEQR